MDDYDWANDARTVELSETISSLREQVRTLTAERDEARYDFMKAKHALEGYATSWEGAEKEADALRKQVAELEEEHEEDQGVIRVWRGRTERAEAERDAALERARVADRRLADAKRRAVDRTAIEAIVIGLGDGVSASYAAHKAAMWAVQEEAP